MEFCTQYHKLTLRKNKGLESEGGKARSKRSGPKEEDIALCYLRPGRGDQAKPQPLSNPSFFSAVSYKSNLAPHSLTFDEAALFWRLRLGEGIPNRRWHKPLDPSKTWHEVKAGLDQKIEASHKNYEKGLFARFFSKIVKVIKQSFLLE